MIIVRLTDPPSSFLYNAKAKIEERGSADEEGRGGGIGGDGRGKP